MNGLVGRSGKCGADRAAQITRDTGPSAALSGIAAHAYAAATPPPCGRTSLTRSRAGATPDPIRATVCPRRANAPSKNDRKEGYG